MQECLYTLRLPAEEFCCLLIPLNIVVTAVSAHTVFRDTITLCSGTLTLSFIGSCGFLQLQWAEIKFVWDFGGW